MAEIKKIVAAVFMLFATAPIFGAEGMEEATAQPSSSINGDAKGIEWRAVTDSLTSKTWLQMSVPSYGEYLVEQAWATRLVGRFVSASSDSTGTVHVSVELDKAGQKLERQFICRDSVWLKANAGQAVAWTEVSFETEKEYRTVEDYQLLSKANAGHYSSFNEGYQRPRFTADATAQSQFGKPDFTKKQASAKKGKKGDFRITTTDEETRTTKRGKKVKVLRG